MLARPDVLIVIFALLALGLVLLFFLFRKSGAVRRALELHERYLTHYVGDYIQLDPDVLSRLDEVSGRVSALLVKLERAKLLEGVLHRGLLQASWLAGGVLRFHQPNTRRLKGGKGEDPDLTRRVADGDRFFVKLGEFLEAFEGAAARGDPGPAGPPVRAVPPAPPLPEGEMKDLPEDVRGALLELAKLKEAVRPVADARSLVVEWLSMFDGARDLFRKMGLKCLECAANGVENLEEAARYHSFDADRILEELGAPRDSRTPA